MASLVRRSIGRQITVFACAVLAAAVLSALLAVALSPSEAPRRVKFGDAVAALAGRPSTLQRRIAASPPGGAPSRLLATALAQALGQPPEAVRATWLDDPGRFTSGREGSVVAIVAGREVAITSHGDAFQLAYGDAMRLPPETAIPPFEAGLRRPDGSWLLVRPRASILQGWRLRLGLWILLGGLLIVPMIRWRVNALTRPIQNLARGADQAALSDEAPPIEEDGPEEIRAVARAINGMHARLLEAAKDRTRMMAAVAHDLRTPLTALRVRAEAAPAQTRDRMAADIARMTAMIEKVMTYAQGGATQSPKIDLDLAALVAACADDAILAGRRVELDRFEPGARVLGCPDELASAVQNLIENADLYAGRARVSCFTQDGQAIVLVTDNGPGIPDAELTKVLEPFARLETSRSALTGGTGLGLTIAHRNASRNAGQLVLSNLEGGGLCARLTFPIN
jgi:signal transduction histidine kinase